MRVIGLTGGIACGKSTLSAAAAQNGVPVLDADAISRALTVLGGEALPAIRHSFGSAVFHADGTLNRRALAAEVFADEERRALLENILHPRVWAHIVSLLKRLSATGVSGALLDVPLLYESGMEELCDAVIVCHVPEAEQVRRAMSRDGMSEHEVRARIRTQMPLADKLARADYAIDTSGSADDTAAAFLALWDALTHSDGDALAVVARYRPILQSRYLS